MTGPSPKSPEQRALTLYGRNITRTTAIYAIGMAAVVPFGVISVAVTTRYLAPGEFGRLAVLFTVSAGLTLLFSAGSLQGTMMWVYGALEDSDGDVIAAEDEIARIPAEKKRQIMSTGLLLIFGLGALVGAALLAIAPALNDLFLGGDGHPSEVRWAVISGAIGAPWRLVQNVFRAERRPVAFSVVAAMRPALVVALTVAALVAGFGVSGALAATAAGTALSLCIAFAASHKVYGFSFNPRLIPEIYRRGVRYLPVTISGFVQSNADVLVLTHTSTAATVGLYRVATRIANMPTYVAHGYLMAWAPLERSPIAVATRKMKGRDEFSSTLFTWLIILVMTMLVFVTLAADALIHIAAPAYRDAAPLIPFAAGAFAAEITFIGFFRAATFPHRQLWFAIVGAASAALYIVLGAVLVPAIGAKGVGLAGVGTFALAALALLYLKQHSGEPIPMQWRRLGLTVGASLGLIVLGTSLPLSSAARATIALAGLAAFPVLLVVLGIVPRHLLGPLRTVAHAMVPDIFRRRALLREVAKLPADERTAVIELAGKGRPLGDVSLASGTSPELTLERLTRGLRKLAAAGDPHPSDHAIGSYLVESGTTVERDDRAVALAHDDVDLMELTEIEAVFDQLRGTPARRWSRSMPPDKPALTPVDVR